MKIVILESTAVNPGDLSWDTIRSLGDVTIYDRTLPMDAAARIGDAEIALINKTPITAEVLDACPNLRLICVQATGYNIVDCEAAKQRGVLVCNIPAYATGAVAQFTFALLLEICHHVGHHDQLVHQGAWTRSPDFCFWDTPQMELAGKTLGIIGYGSIGKAVAKIAEAFGMRVIAYSRTQYPQYTDIYTDMDTLLSQSDIISLHCPLFPETKGMVNENTIQKMKNGAILLNTSRGPLLDEAAVAAALASGKLRAAAVDVTCAEPIPADSPLLTAPNCIITSHMAWAPIEARQRILSILADNITAYLSGRPINVVNP